MTPRGQADPVTRKAKKNGVGVEKSSLPSWKGGSKSPKGRGIPVVPLICPQGGEELLTPALHVTDLFCDATKDP